MNIIRSTKIAILVGIGLSLAVIGLKVFAADAPTKPSVKHERKACENKINPEERLEQLKKDLKIKPDQESAWQAFQDTVKQNMKKMKEFHEQRMKEHDNPKTAPERLHQHIAGMQECLAGMQAMENVLNSLYQVLTGEQKTVLNEHFNRMHGHHRHWHHEC